MSKNPSLRQQTGPFNIGNVISAGLRIYRAHFKLYIGLVIKALLWSVIPIYGWAKNYQIQGIISRHVFKELVNQPESISITRTNLNQRFWSFWAAQFYIALSGFGFIIIVFLLSSTLESILNLFSGNSVGNLIGGIILTVWNIITILAYIWLYSHFFIAELPLGLEHKMNSTNCIGRSWELTKGFVLRIQLIILIASLITLPIIILALLPVLFMIFPLFSTTPSEDALLLTLASSIFLMVVLATVGSTLMMPFWQAIKAVIYYDIRSRREGLGLEVRDSHS